MSQLTPAAEEEDELLASRDEGLDEASQEEEELFFPDVYAFVDEFLIHVHARAYEPTGSWRWCEQWWHHPEAISRLEGLWHAFEMLRLEVGTGPSVWWREHCDPTMAALTDSQGTFAQCKAGREGRHKSPPVLPVTPAPSECRLNASRSHPSAGPGGAAW